MAITLAQFEAVDGALATVLRLPDDPPLDQGRDAFLAWQRPHWILLDACIDAGMPITGDNPTEWASELVTRCLCSATMVECVA